jgi:D-amino peptidase
MLPGPQSDYSIFMGTTLDGTAYRHILILADIEGSSGCDSYRASAFLTRPWAHACAAMSRDVDAVVKRLFAAGVRQVTVKDFHRTAFNLLPELIDPRARVVCGYRRGPVPGLGHPGDADAVMMIGMHAAAGTDGFLPHTLTSRLASLTVNGRPLAEVELFSAALAPFDLPTIFFSGCPAACDQARERIFGVHTCAIDKSAAQRKFSARQWRNELAAAAVAALGNHAAAPYRPDGPFVAAITIRDGATAAAKMADPWGFERIGRRVVITATDMHGLYRDLIRLCYLPRWAEKTMPLSLGLFNLVGRLGRLWVRRQLFRDRAGHRCGRRRGTQRH